MRNWLIILLALTGLACHSPTDTSRISVAAEPAVESAPEPANEPAPEPQSEQTAAPGETSGETSGDPLPNPFPNRVLAPDFPVDSEWLNVAGPMRMQDLRGKFVLFDFWTYCCINCIHVLPELKKLERAYPDDLVVIGIHSAKFEAEKGRKNIEEAILRYEIEHPVINDADHGIWQMYGVRSWPTVLLIDPEGHAIWGKPGEVKFKEVDVLLKDGIPYYRQEGLLDSTPIRFDLLAHRQQETPLRFPGKVLADPKSDRLFIADSNHNRIVVSTRSGRLLEKIGSGAIGRADGDFRSASFDHPQGMVLVGEILYVADTENHMLRKVDLKSKRVVTIAGTGSQAERAWPGLEKLTAADPLPERWVGPPMQTALNSPWALWVHGKDLYIAMAGPHQIWSMPLDESEIGPYAGNGREDIVDGPLLPQRPYDLGYSSFAQPSGLASDGRWLYVADSEGSSIRAVPFDRNAEVMTVVGTSQLPHARLFTFGDQDGKREDVLLQHALGVVHDEGTLYIADTYNNKIKAVDAETGETHTLAGTGNPGASDELGEFDEPAGITFADGTLFVADTNNHAIRTINVATGSVGTLSIEGLDAPSVARKPQRPRFARAKQIKLDTTNVKATAGAVKLQVQLDLPEGWKINTLAPADYWLSAEGTRGPVDRSALGRKALSKAAGTFMVTVPLKGEGTDTLTLGMQYFYCQEGAEGLCKIGSVVWTVPLSVGASGSSDPVRLMHQVSAN